MTQTVVFLGSKPIGYESLKFLLENQKDLDIKVIAIATKTRTEFSGDGDLNQLAESYQIATIHHPDEIPECDIIVSVQYHKILKQHHIDKAGKIAVNLHLAPLPEYRGCNQFSFAIFDDCKEFGVTLHEIDTDIDHGDILFENRFPIPEKCWVNDLYQLSVQKGLDLFKNKMPLIIKGEYSKTPQDALQGIKPSYIHFRKEIENLKIINLEDDLSTTERRIRATMMPGFEPPFYIENGEKVYYKNVEQD